MERIEKEQSPLFKLVWLGYITWIYKHSEKQAWILWSD